MIFNRSASLHYSSWQSLVDLLINILLWILGWIPGVLHAWWVHVTFTNGLRLAPVLIVLSVAILLPGGSSRNLKELCEVNMRTWWSRNSEIDPDHENYPSFFNTCSIFSFHFISKHLRSCCCVCSWSVRPFQYYDFHELIFSGNNDLSSFSNNVWCVWITWNSP